MIKSARVLKGWPIDRLAAFKDKKTFKFTPGVNILFGPNGSGKTTLLRILGAYCGCPEHGGWSSFVAPSSTFGTKDKKYPSRFVSLTPHRECYSKVTWDGTATFLHLAPESDAPLVAFGMPHDILTDSDQVSLMMSKASSGQNRLVRLNKVLETLVTPPDLTKLTIKANSVWTDEVKSFADYVASLSRAGPETILFDEPERSLDIKNQILFWSRILPGMGLKRQVIVATHSPLCLLTNGMNVIDMVPGYYAEAKALVADMVKA